MVGEDLRTKFFEERENDMILGSKEKDFNDLFMLISQLPFKTRATRIKGTKLGRLNIHQ